MRELKITQSITTRDESLNRYLAEISKIPMLTTDEEVSLAAKIRQGDEEALEKLVKGNLRFVVSVAKQYQCKGISLMDLMFTAKDLIGMYAKTIECLFLLVVFYLIMLLPVSILGSILERRLRYAGFGD